MYVWVCNDGHVDDDDDFCSMIEVDERVIGSIVIWIEQKFYIVQVGERFLGWVDIRASHIKQLKLSMIRIKGKYGQLSDITSGE